MNSYESWRISFQDSEQAARAAFNSLASAQQRCEALGGMVEYAFSGGFEAGIEYTSAHHNKFIDGTRPNRQQAWEEWKIEIPKAKALLKQNPSDSGQEEGE